LWANYPQYSASHELMI